MHVINRKGFVISPFVVVVLIFLGSVIFAYLTSIDSNRAGSIIAEGEINQGVLNIEEVKSAAISSILFSAYQSCYDVGEVGGNISDLGDSITEGMNKYFMGFRTGEGVYLEGNFSVSVHATEGGYFTVRSVSHPTAFLNTSRVSSTANITVDRLVDVRFFLLYNFSRDFNKKYFLDQYTMRVVDELKRSFNISVHYNLSDNSTVILNASVADTRNLDNSSFIARKIFEGSLVRMVNDSGLLYGNLTSRGCIITFKPDSIVVGGRKSYVNGTTRWDINSTVSINVSFYDRSLLEETSFGDFMVNVTCPIILNNGSWVPFSYRIPEPVTVGYEIILTYNGNVSGDSTNYTVDDFGAEQHLPVYRIVA
ncbi:MAG: hypothetical protein KAU03_02805 [Candidatus Altiarchaeales archaeon]|nr:hypothetical protein [Candidatus Altiarchaeales archaeon]